MVDFENDPMGDKFNAIETALERLQAHVDEQFTHVDERFQRVDQQFQRIDEQFQRVDERFQRVDQQFQRVDEQFQRVDERFQELRQFVADESAETRRHMTVLYEKMITERNLVLDLGQSTFDQVKGFFTSSAVERDRVENTLADHEVRLHRLENRTDPRG